MFGLYVVRETLTNGYITEVLDVISLVSILSGILVIISKNPIISVLFLIGLFLSIASYLIIIGITFIGLSYLLVYVGAVSILFLFILMLINVRISELFTETSNSITLAIIIAILFNYTVYQILPYSLAAFSYTIYLKNLITNYYFSNNHTDYINKNLNFYNDNGEITYVTDRIWDGSLAENTHITSIGNIMYTSYSI